MGIYITFYTKSNIPLHYQLASSSGKTTTVGTACICHISTKEVCRIEKSILNLVVLYLRTLILINNMTIRKGKPFHLLRDIRV